MMLNLHTLEDLPARVILEDDASRLDFDAEGVDIMGRARAEFDVILGDHIYYCTGLAACEANLACARCLEPYHVTLQGEIEFSIHEMADGQEISPDDVLDNEIIVPANTTEVDITAPVREALLLALPFKPLCREDCRGLCPICGVNRNEHTCECKVEKTDTRWDGLRNLLK